MSSARTIDIWWWYHLFPKLKDHLNGQFFRSDDECKEKVKCFPSTLFAESSHIGIQKLNKVIHIEKNSSKDLTPARYLVFTYYDSLFKLLNVKQVVKKCNCQRVKTRKSLATNESVNIFFGHTLKPYEKCFLSSLLSKWSSKQLMMTLK